jgi:hypothetical protein
MMNPTQHQTVSDPWRDKGERFRLISALAFLACFVFAAYDGGTFYARYLKQCSEEPWRAECRPLNPVKEVRPPDLGITMDYEKGKWALNVGQRQEEGQANDLASRLRSYGVEPRLIKVLGKGGAAQYQLQVGRFPNRKVAAEAGAQLQSKGVIQDFRPDAFQPSK